MLQKRAEAQPCLAKDNTAVSILEHFHYIKKKERKTAVGRSVGEK
jgi:hypothetical protein